MIARLANWKKASKGFTGDTEKPLWLFRKKSYLKRLAQEFSIITPTKKTNSNDDSQLTSEQQLPSKDVMKNLCNRTLDFHNNYPDLFDKYRS